MRGFTKIALFVCIFSLVLGFAACGVAASIGFSLSDIRNVNRLPSFFGLNDYFYDELKEAPEGKDWKKDNYSFNKKEVDSLNIDIKCGEVIIEKTESNSDITVLINYRTVYRNFSRKISCKLSNGELIIDDKSNKIFNNLKNAYITVQLPDTIVLEKIEIETGAGTTKINQDLYAKNIKLDIDAGELYNSDSTIKADEEIQIDSGIGSVSLNKIIAKKIEIEGGVGETKVEQIEADDLEISCGMGSIQIGLVGEEKEYNYKVDCGVGSVSIDNNNYSGLGSTRVIDNNSKKDVNIDCGVGDVDVDFID